MTDTQIEYWAHMLDESFPSNEGFDIKCPLSQAGFDKYFKQLVGKVRDKKDVDSLHILSEISDTFEEGFIDAAAALDKTGACVSILTYSQNLVLDQTIYAHDGVSVKKGAAAAILEYLKSLEKNLAFHALNDNLVKYYKKLGFEIIDGKSRLMANNNSKIKDKIKAAGNDLKGKSTPEETDKLKKKYEKM